MDGIHAIISYFGKGWKLYVMRKQKLLKDEIISLLESREKTKYSEELQIVLILNKKMEASWTTEGHTCEIWKQFFALISEL